jgi:alkanesulfonate monooxygenase SsuD/methylene tetrahydromethanopterin reductase-like flavin-dependent oxidoreductase (luciferase family)
MSDGADAVFIDAGPLGDPFVLAAALAPLVPGILLGVRLSLSADGRHPAMLAREVTCLEHVNGGRTVVCFLPPFTPELSEAVALCRAMWREGAAVSLGPAFPVEGAVNRPGPPIAGSPLVALDLTSEATGAPAALAELLLHPTASPDVCRLERV